MTPQKPTTRGERTIDSSGLPSPGVIVVAEPAVFDVLAGSGASWRLQDRQGSVAEMWDALSGGRLDSRSRILVFSDSQRVGQVDDESERGQVARAVVAMTKAGARVFVVCHRPERWEVFNEGIRSAAVAQGVEPDSLTYHRIDLGNDPASVLDPMRAALGAEVSFPATPPSPQVVATERPTLPPIGADEVTDSPAPVAGEYPENASRELLDRPKLPGQVTITVTSSKGGSGKSTVSILLAGTIARASAEAGRPLKVCLLDLDTRDGQVASLIGKFMPTALNIRVQPVWDEERIRRNLVHAEGLDIETLLAPIRPRTADTVGPEFYRTIVRSLQRMFDVIVMDTSVQYLEPLIADVALVESDEVLFVTTLASTAIQGMARALREITAPSDESGLGIPREKIGIVVNQSLANVGMERDQVLAAGLGVPVVGVIPLATKDVLTATNLNRMHELLRHPVVGPAYNDLARACLPGRELAAWQPPEDAARPEQAPAAPESTAGSSADDGAAKRRGLFRR